MKSELLTEALEPTQIESTDIVTFLACTLGRGGAQEVQIVETHMSWVLLAGDRAYKLKKATRSSYLDFSTTARREMACRAEMRLNQRLAPGIYLDVAPIWMGRQGLSLVGPGKVVDWLVVMRRLDLALTLDNMISTGRMSPGLINRVGHTLIRFYRKTARCAVMPHTFVNRWRSLIRANKAVLFDKRFDLPKEMLFRTERALQHYLTKSGDLIAARIMSGKIRECHGDLRPEHIWLGCPIAIIDCLEFDAKLRELDPLDELSYLQIECERLGAGWVGRRIQALVCRDLGNGQAEGLSHFYSCYRASLRARLALAHLLDAQPRTPEKWLPLAKIYLRIADQHARQIEQHLARQRTSVSAKGGFQGTPL